uniref:Uncharacterized protein n=1 Tax=Arundo donax TaxID=35708 RepID=A0A0A8Y5B0_ARUDO
MMHPAASGRYPSPSCSASECPGRRHRCPPWITLMQRLQVTPPL